MKLRKNWILVVTSITVGTGVSTVLLYGKSGWHALPIGFWPVLPFIILIAILCGKAMSLVNRKTNHWLSWDQSVSVRFLFSFIISVLVLVFAFSMVIVPTLAILNKQTINAVLITQQDTLLKVVILSTIIGLVHTLVSFLAYAYYHYAEGQIAALRQDRKQLRLQFEALKSQLSPHYLFNSLNTISSLIHKDKDKAELFIRKLAETYTYVLDSKNHRLVSLEEELAFIESYYYLLQVRFGHTIRYECKIKDHLLSMALPPLSIQILMENAIKHNTCSQDTPLSIKITSTRAGSLTIENNKTTSPIHVSSMKVGLNNIRLRYSFFTHDPVQIEDGDCFKVSLPLLSAELIKQRAA